MMKIIQDWPGAARSAKIYSILHYLVFLMQPEYITGPPALLNISENLAKFKESQDFKNNGLGISPTLHWKKCRVQTRKNTAQRTTWYTDLDQSK